MERQTMKRSLPQRAPRVISVLTALSEQTRFEVFVPTSSVIRETSVGKSKSREPEHLAADLPHASSPSARRLMGYFQTLWPTAASPKRRSFVNIVIYPSSTSPRSWRIESTTVQCGKPRRVPQQVAPRPKSEHSVVAMLYISLILAALPKRRKHSG